MGRIMMLLGAAVIVSIAAANAAYRITTAPHRTPEQQPWADDTMQFVSWNGERWSAWIRDGVFELRPQRAGKWSSHANPSVAFIDAEGNTWQAKIDGDFFILAKRGDWNGPTQRAAAIHYRDWVGHEQLRTVAQLGR